LGGGLLGATADFANQDDSFGFGIVLKQFQQVNER
jgi:hypothetical protein